MEMLFPQFWQRLLGKIENDIKDRSWFPRVWLRYVDDVFAVINKNSEEEILSLLNTKHTNIKFTMEMESDGKLPFLDLLLMRERQGITFYIFRKPTDAPLCIPRECHYS